MYQHPIVYLISNVGERFLLDTLRAQAAARKLTETRRTRAPRSGVA